MQLSDWRKIQIILITFFVVALLAANCLGSMILEVSLFGWILRVSAGVYPFAVTFIITDWVNEFYGRKAAEWMTWLGFGFSLLLLGLFVLISGLPVMSDSPLPLASVLQTGRLFSHMLLASMTAYVVGQLLDIGIFQKIRQITNKRYFWVRATVSTVFAQAVDTIIVISIAFWGVYSLTEFWELVLGNYIWKLSFVLGVSPVLSLGHHWLNMESKALFAEEEAMSI